MRVERVAMESGSRVEPPMDPAWDDLTKLQWLAAVAELDTGLSVSVEPAGVRRRRFGQWHNVGGLYNVRCRNTVAGPFSYTETDSLLFGVSFGARVTRGGRA